MRYTAQQYAKALRKLVEENPLQRREAIKQFAQTLASQNALSFLPDIIREFESERLREKKVRRIAVHVPKRDGTGYFKRAFRGKTEVSVLSDVRLHGGVIIERDDTRVDNSVAMRLGRLKQALTE